MGTVAVGTTWPTPRRTQSQEFVAPNRVLEAMESAWRLLVHTAKPYALIGSSSWQSVESQDQIVIDVPASNGSGHSDLIEEFTALASKWSKETYNLSTGDIELHPAYLRVIALGRPALPLILRELRDHGGHWFWALEAITKANPAADATSVTAAKQAWLQWGRANGLI